MIHRFLYVADYKTLFMFLALKNSNLTNYSLTNNQPASDHWVASLFYKKDKISRLKVKVYDLNDTTNSDNGQDNSCGTNTLNMT